MRLKNKISIMNDMEGGVVIQIPLQKAENEDLSDVYASAEELSVGDEINLKISKKRKKRSLDANAYCWILIKELAKKLQINNEDCYKHLIRLGGEYEIFPMKNEAVERWVEIWQSHGPGWVSDVIGDSKIEGYTNVRSYYGISVYDTKQMARFIDVVIDACKENGVPTATRTEIERYKGEWK